ncbi:MAG: bacillithiol biosynthesis deacetylase BshB1 [Rhodothermales bacterium]|nr:bacillithiol biosynthesis deacetylase BshB1 [Rhodothermales bacterium]
MSNLAKLDVLVFGAHPDDAELFCGGTICSMTSMDYRVGIVDLTRGELGSRGSASLRTEEATEAARISGVSVRTNLGLADGNIENTFDNRLGVIRVIRRHQPEIILMNARECRHPDHGAASELVGECTFYSGLRRIESFDAGESQEAWRPKHVLEYVQAIPFEPSLVVDVSHVWEQRMASLMAFKSQFYNPDYKNNDEPDTYISNEGFLKSVEARARMQGLRIGATFGEGFRNFNGPIGTKDIVATLMPE